MKDFFKKTFGWLGESNRLQHVIAGTVVFVFTFFFADLLFNCVMGTQDIVSDVSFSSSLITFYSLISLLATLVAMCSVEYIQFRIYGKPGWDNLDILAGCLPGLIITLAVLVIG